MTSIYDESKKIDNRRLIQMSHVLIYRQTHLDDPGDTGVFGINDCMGRIRDLDFEAVIAILRSEVSWVGIGARKIRWPGHNHQVTFQHFASILPAQSYPVPPHLDQFMTGKRYIVHPLLTQTKTPLIIEIRIVLQLAINAPPSKGGISERKICPMRDDQDAELPGVVLR
jgi:hypothetical protein